MVKTLIRHGNSMALVIDKAVLEMLRVTADTPLEVTTDGDCILISPIRPKARQARLRKALARINRRYGDDLKRLAK